MATANGENVHDACYLEHFFGRPFDLVVGNVCADGIFHYHFKALRAGEAVRFKITINRRDINSNMSPIVPEQRIFVFSGYIISATSDGSTNVCLFSQPQELDLLATI